MRYSPQPRLYLVLRENARAARDPESFSIAGSPSHAPAAFTTFTTHLVARAAQKPSLPSLMLLEAHLERVVENGIALGNVDSRRAAAIKQILRDAVPDCIRSFIAEHSLTQTRITTRIVIRRGEELEIFLEPYVCTWSPAGIRTVTYEGRRPLAAIKSSLLDVSRAAREHALSHDAEEALLVSDNMLLEGAWCNVFWFDRSGNLHTPRSSVLPGVIRGVILSHHCCTAEDAALSEFLANAAEVFVTQSTSGITPVVSVGEHRFSSGMRTRQMLEWYESYVEAQSEPLFGEVA